jgi:iron complex outermembrane receptor protein
LAIAFAAPAVTHAQELAPPGLEDLFAQEVTSVAKRPQNVQQAAAAVFVITREDIRRSGVANVPDLLRMVPGLEVADLVSGGAAVSARGFNNAVANKLLVLVDGRAIYVSALSAVAWDQQLGPVEDIDRIEVVRGPGAALWGANAVNGVINVITKHAVDSLGGAATAEVDTREAGRLYLRQGFRIGETGTLRLYGAARRVETDSEFRGVAIPDRAHAWQVGFRFDTEPTDRDAFTLQGDVQEGRYSPVPADIILGPSFPVVAGRFTGHNILARWTHTGSSRSSLQVYYDELDRLQAVDEGVSRRLFDAEFSNQRQISTAHDLVWGLTFRRAENRYPRSPLLVIAPSDQQTYGGYVQDELTLVPQRLKLTLGAKLEHNPRTGTEFQPSVRGIWTDAAGWSLWAAASQARRIPSARESDVSADLRPIPIVVVNGRPDAEQLTAFEIGWRGPIAPQARLDVTAYHNRYRKLIAYSLQPTLIDGAVTPAFQPGNLTASRAYGVEASVDWQVRPWWTLKAAASWQDIKTDPIAGVYVLLGGLGGERSPRAQASLRSQMDLGSAVELDAWLRRVGPLADGLTPAYTALDLRLAWRVTDRLEFAVRGENLLGVGAPQMRTDVGDLMIAPSVLSDRRVSVTAAVRY